MFCCSKSKILPFDDLIKLCCDFYREEEILEARAVLSNFCKLYKRKGSERMRNTMEDIVKAILNPDLHLPVFYAIDLSRLPPTDVNHCLITVTCLQ